MDENSKKQRFKKAFAVKKFKNKGLAFKGKWLNKMKQKKKENEDETESLNLEDDMEQLLAGIQLEMPDSDTSHLGMVVARSNGRIIGGTEDEGILSVKWYRAYKDEKFVSIEGIKSGFYQPSYDDIGARICIQCNRVDGGMGGAFAEIGPLKLDEGLSESIEEHIQSDHAEINVEMFDETSTIQNCILVLTSQRLILRIGEDDAMNKLWKDFIDIYLDVIQTNFFSLKFAGDVMGHFQCEDNKIRDLITALIRHWSKNSSKDNETVEGEFNSDDDENANEDNNEDDDNDDKDKQNKETDHCGDGVSVEKHEEEEIKSENITKVETETEMETEKVKKEIITAEETEPVIPSEDNDTCKAGNSKSNIPTSNESVHFKSSRKSFDRSSSSRLSFERSRPSFESNRSVHGSMMSDVDSVRDTVPENNVSTGSDMNSILLQSLVDSAQAETVAAQKLADELQRELIRVREEVKIIANERTTIQRKYKEVEKSRDSLISQNRRLADQITQLEECMKAAQEQAETLRKDAEESQNAISIEANEKVEEFKKQLKKMMASFEVKDHDLDQAMTQIAQKDDLIAELKQQVSELELSEVASKSLISNQQASLDELNEKVQDLHNELQGSFDTGIKYSALETEHSQLRGEFQDTLTRAEEAERRLTMSSRDHSEELRKLREEVTQCKLEQTEASTKQRMAEQELSAVSAKFQRQSQTIEDVTGQRNRFRGKASELQKTLKKVFEDLKVESMNALESRVSQLAKFPDQLQQLKDQLEAQKAATKAVENQMKEQQIMGVTSSSSSKKKSRSSRSALQAQNEDLQRLAKDLYDRLDDQENALAQQKELKTMLSDRIHELERQLKEISPSNDDR
eukprot:TRINITY_DN2177_c0_g2_i1.p1 TRINITY_DN2177_c0_g2~~TRINITY_DN2177_c0_g2_i1.p1  ORF type:complete len:858 (-),score=253.75 TRINITY_DN2177_c0_g2_i1:749-3322(-)